MKIHGMEIKHLSYSSISLWNRCPREWLMKYKYQTTQAPGAALPFGTAMHRSVQRGLTTEADRQWLPGDFYKDLKRAVIESKVHVGEKEFNELVIMGSNMLADEMTRFILRGIRVSDPSNVERRIEFYVPGVPIPVVGYIDIIDDDGQLYDIKTSKWGWTDQQAVDELQPDFYLTGMDELGDTRHGGVFNHIVMIKDGVAPVSYILSTQRGSEYIQRVHGVVLAMWDGVVQGDWSRHGMCGQCKLLPQCEAIR